jgi:maltooligosyltrehalose synthase
VVQKEQVRAIVTLVSMRLHRLKANTRSQLIPHPLLHTTVHQQQRGEDISACCVALELKNIAVLQIVGRSDTLKDNATVKKGAHMPKIAMRRALKGLRNAAQNTTT